MMSVTRTGMTEPKPIPILPPWTIRDSLRLWAWHVGIMLFPLMAWIADCVAPVCEDD